MNELVDPWARMALADFEQLASIHGTPFFLYDADTIRARVGALRQAFSGAVGVYYAVKANPNLGLLRALASDVDGLDISSAGELDQARAAGFEPARLSFAGPAKTSLELRAAIACGVGSISVESVRELAACARAAGELGIAAHVALRVNPLRANTAYGLKMGGKATQFGIDEESLPECLALLRAHGRVLDFVGLHVYAGSQGFDARAVADGILDTLRIATDIETAGFACRAINLGGGFGVSHSSEGKTLDVRELAERVTPELQRLSAASPRSRRIYFELGRYLAADAGIYVSRVISTKSSREKEFAVVDGGLHHHLAAAGTFGAALRSNFDLCNLSRPNRPTMRCHVAGPSCNPTDLLGVDVELARPEIGDLIGVLRSGSYGLTASPVLFLGRGTPAEFVRDRGNIAVARRPRSMLDFN